MIRHGDPRLRAPSSLLALLAACVTTLATAAWAGEPVSERNGGTDKGWAPTVILILGGQSNMVGQGKAAELPAELKTGPAHVRIWGRKGWTELKPAGTFGPEVGLAAAMAKAWPDERIGLVKHAVGGTSLLAWAPEWTKEAAAKTGNEKQGPLYAEWKKKLDAARKTAPGAPVRAAFCMQGERDASYQEAADAYKANFAKLIAAVRRDASNEKLPFVFGRIRSNKLRAIVRKAQEETAKEVPGVAMVNTDDLQPTNNIHWGTQGQLELGRRFAAACLDLTSRKNGMPEGKDQP
jgi:hypothetical protein